MKDKDKKTKEHGEEETETTTPVYTEPIKKEEDDQQTALLNEINITLTKDLDFYKTQLAICNDKLKMADEMLRTAQGFEQKYKEMQLDYENLKKRSKTAIETAEEDGIIKAVKAILPTVDNFRRAIVSITDPNTVEGLKMIYKQLMEGLSKLDVEEIPALGLQFDPEIHNAVMQVDDEDNESGTVVEILQKGYIKGDKVIRYTQVKIAK